MFKVGDPIRRHSYALPSAPIGFETVVVEPVNGVIPGRVWYVDKDGDKVHGGVEHFELIAATGPVRTVTRQEIIPGMYDGVDVRDRFGNGVPVEIKLTHMDHAALTRAAAVLTALAGALRDGE